MKPARRTCLALIFALSPVAALAQADGRACSDITDKGVSYSVCAAPAKGSDLRLFLRDPEGKPYGAFSAIDRDLAKRGERLAFAMNAGMYHEDRSPVGLYIENGAQAKGLSTRGGFGNFHMRPNGVFWIGPGGAQVTETSRYARLKPKAAYATQSGPMLVIAGKLHPRFSQDSDSLKVRNGVGLCRDGRVRFVISNARVSFHDFAVLFRDRLGCPDALYLDGSISALHAPDLKRSDGWRPMGPIVGLVAKAR
ncbi:MAG: phosphodiester glycosidase family protein [Beijerinckiaceae bacterium]|jgi:uncharacterized protein YigE (DUF2233 family)|nr:phosphodiester glycosidase family protein [Beijerinckiaceae bacterium]